MPTYDPLSASQLRASAAAANQTLYPGKFQNIFNIIYINV